MTQGSYAYSGEFCPEAVEVRKMEVGRENFLSILPVVEESIKTAHYIAIDAEFTGSKNPKIAY